MEANSEGLEDHDRKQEKDKKKKKKKHYDVTTDDMTWNILID